MIQFREIIVELSYNCNLSCTMCGFGKDHNPYSKSKFLSFDEYRIILTQIGSITNSIRLNGRGESTIHPEFIEILNYTKKSFPKININLFSNFSFSNPKILKSLVDNHVQLFISVDSPVKGEFSAIRKGGSFELVENNISSLKNELCRPFIIFTIQEANIHRIYDIAKFAYNYNCNILYNTIRKDTGIDSFIKEVERNSKSIKEQLEKAYALFLPTSLKCFYPDQLAGVQLNTFSQKQTNGSINSCPALNEELCILFDGSTTPCNMFNPYYYGNFFSQTLNDIWHGQNRLDFLINHKNYYCCKNCANLGM